MTGRNGIEWPHPQAIALCGGVMFAAGLNNGALALVVLFTVIGSWLIMAREEGDA